MTSTIPDVLSRIVDRKREELRAANLDRAQLEVQAEELVLRRRSFAAALRNAPPAIIAEIKRASPSKGLLVQDYEPSVIAGQYEAGGAAALSVLTDRDFFQGSLEHLKSARAASRLPVLRKDFTIDELHVLEAAASGADAILLIAAILTETQLRHYRELAGQFLIAALVEVHDDEELNKALASGAAIIGVNNRDLRTFEVHLETSLNLAARIPSQLIRVSESGINTHEDVTRLAAAGFNAFLVGEHLMRSLDPSAAVKALRCS